MVSAAEVLAMADSYEGVMQGSWAHRGLIDAYNEIEPVPQGYCVTYDDDWCDVFVTVCGDKAGASDLIGRECGVNRHLTWFKAQGIWLGKVTPQIGDIVVFSYNGVIADHIGFVRDVADTGAITTIEGNYLNQVARVWHEGDAPTIMGYARPRYDEMVAGAGCVDLGSGDGGETEWKNTISYGFKLAI